MLRPPEEFEERTAWLEHVAAVFGHQTGPKRQLGMYDEMVVLLVERASEVNHNCRR